MSTNENVFDEFVDLTVKTHTTQKVRKYYTIYTSGSLAGRDDGYPERTHMDFVTLEGVARFHGKEVEEEYVLVTETARTLILGEVNQIVRAGQKMLKEAKEREQLQKDSDELRRLARKLGVNLVPKMD